MNVEEAIESLLTEEIPDPFSPAERSNIDGIKKNLMALGDTEEKSVKLAVELRKLSRELRP